MIRKRLLLSVCFYYVTFILVKGFEFNKYFSDDEIKQVFHRSRDEIPNHKFIDVKNLNFHRSKREIRPVEITDDEGKKIFLSLTPIDNNVVEADVPVWVVKTDPLSNSFHSYQKLEPKNIEDGGTFYQDAENAAVLLAYYRDRYIYYDGVIGDGSTKVVRSIPEKWWKKLRSSEGNHIIFDAVNNENSKTQILDGNFEDLPDELDEPLEIMYPKILVIVEFNLFKSLGEDVDETLKYVSTFWNAVNLKYQNITSPKIQIKVTGIIIEKDMTALRYIYDAINKTDTNTLFNTPLGGQMDYFAKDFVPEVGFKNYDATMTMLNLNAGSLAGQAYPGQICGPTSNVAFVVDDGSFSGLHPAIHELGHLLNLPHDGDTGYAARSCDGYPAKNIQTVMAPYNLASEKTVWSECSEEILQKFAWQKRAECLRHPYRQSRP